MNKHLPECPVNKRLSWFRQKCICPALCACEQRVRDEIAADGPWFRSVVHKCCEDKQTAYAAGLDAAREAVAGMNLPSGITYLVGTDRRDLAEMVRRAALDLIDALRGQPQDKTSVQRSFEKSLDSDSTLTRAQVARLEKAAALAAIDALRGES